jgi:hypothetical protein
MALKPRRQNSSVREELCRCSIDAKKNWFHQESRFSSSTSLHNEIGKENKERTRIKGI